MYYSEFYAMRNDDLCEIWLRWKEAKITNNYNPLREILEKYIRADDWKEQFENDIQGEIVNRWIRQQKTEK